MPRELIAPARERVAFRDYEREPLAANQVRVRSQFGAAKHGTEMAVYKGYGLPRGRYDGELGIFTGTAGDGDDRRPGTLPRPAGEHVHRRGDRGRQRGHRGATGRPGVLRTAGSARNTCGRRTAYACFPRRSLAGRNLPRSDRLRARRGARRPCAHRRRGGRVRDGRDRPDGAAARAAGRGAPGDCRRPDRAAPRGGARAGRT